MNPAQEPDSLQPTATERTQFRLSRQLDSDLTSEESAALVVLQQNDSDQAYLAAISNLRNQLQTLPVKPVSESFATSVRDAIHRESTIAPAVSSPDRGRGRIVRRIVAVSVTACAAALMLFLRPFDVGRDAQITQSNGSPAVEKALAISTNVAAVGTDADAAATRREAAEHQEAVTRQEELRPFLENDDWRIVVVKVHSKDREEVMRDIEALVAKNGMDIRPISGGVDHDERFGVLLTSTGIDDRAFIESLIPLTDAQSADWDAQSVAESTRESLIRRLQESLKIPTHSELHFGQVYVTLPKTTDSAVVADRPLLAKNSVIDNAVFPPATAEKATEPPTRIAAASQAPTPKMPVLVVFEFTDAAINRI